MNKYLIAILVSVLCLEFVNSQNIGGIPFGPMPGPMNTPAVSFPVQSRRTIQRSSSKDFWPGPGFYPVAPKESGVDFATIMLLQRLAQQQQQQPQQQQVRRTTSVQRNMLPFMMAGNMIEEEMLPFFLMNRGF